MLPLNIAIIGAGGISRAHVTAARNSGGTVKVVGVVDPAEQARRAVVDLTGSKGFTSVEEFLASESMRRSTDAVLVCTPPNQRVQIVKLVLSRGLHVMVEKPLASTARDALALVELAGKHPNLVCAVGYCHRFTPAVNEIRKCINDGSLGTILRFENTFACWFPAMKEKWFSDPQISGGGSFLDTGCHSLDLYRYLLGEAKVVAATVQHEWAGRGESTATVLLRGTTHKTTAAVIQSGWLEPARFVVTVVGTKGLLSYDYEKPTELHYKPSEGNPDTLPVETHEVRFDRQLLAFADAVRNAGKTEQMARFVDGAVVANLVEDALSKGWSA